MALRAGILFQLVKRQDQKAEIPQNQAPKQGGECYSQSTKHKAPNPTHKGIAQARRLGGGNARIGGNLCLGKLVFRRV